MFPGKAHPLPQHYPSARHRPKKPLRTPSLPATPLRRLEPFKETTVDEVSEEKKGYGSSSLSSSSTSSRHINHRARYRESEGDEQQDASPPTVWSPEPHERGTGDVRNPLLQRPQWKPQDHQGQ